VQFPKTLPFGRIFCHPSFPSFPSVQICGLRACRAAPLLLGVFALILWRMVQDESLFMTTRDIMSGCNAVIVGGILVNALDYSLTRSAGFFLFPRAGAARRFFMGWSVLLALLALGNMLNLLPVIYPMFVLTAYVACSQGYAVCCRHWGKGG
jgi:hypothetical protein